MVKVDFNRDYYADLELPPTADVNDIKKQFRKLGKDDPRAHCNPDLWLTVELSAQVPPRPQSRPGGGGQRSIPDHSVCPRDLDKPGSKVQVRHQPETLHQPLSVCLWCQRESLAGCLRAVSSTAQADAHAPTKHDIRRQPVFELQLPLDPQDPPSRPREPICGLGKHEAKCEDPS